MSWDQNEKYHDLPDVGAYVEKEHKLSHQVLGEWFNGIKLLPSKCEDICVSPSTSSLGQSWYDGTEYNGNTTASGVYILQ